MSGSRRPRRSGCDGFTLIELLVALVLGLMVLGAVIALYLSNTQAAQFQSGLLRMQENGRFAIDVLSRTMRMAGYDDPLTVATVPTPLINGTSTSSGTLITQTGLKTTADTVAVRYEGGSEIRDCQGRLVAASDWVTNQYAISTDNNLVCATFTNSSSITRAGVTLAEGVEDMQVLYGIDLDNNGVANRYVAAENVGNWTQVVSIQVAILVSSVSTALASAETVCVGCTVFSGTSDYLLRAEFVTTIGIRN